jgi:uncharacterized protein
MNSADVDIRAIDGGIEIRLHIQPRARKSGIVGIHNKALKVKISAPPVDDAANRAIIDYFSGLLGLPKSNIKIASGLKSKEKALQIKGISLQIFFEMIEKHFL